MSVVSEDIIGGLKMKLSVEGIENLVRTGPFGGTAELRRQKSICSTRQLYTGFCRLFFALMGRGVINCY